MSTFKVSRFTKERISPLLQRVCGDGTLVNLTVTNYPHRTIIEAWVDHKRIPLFEFRRRMSEDEIYPRIMALREYLDTGE